jgi:uncharacterized damage-inducible protein DinB
MSIASTLLAEFEEQSQITRRFLERLPEDKLTWKPHAKSMTAGQLALHLATVPGSVVRAVTSPTGQSPDFSVYPSPATRDEVLSKFDETIATVRQQLPAFSDTSMNETWRMFDGEAEVVAMPRQAFIRNVMFSHWYQHRGQFSVYLRILGIPVPASWGPSADEQPARPQLQKEAVSA